MKLFSKAKDGGPESHVTGYWLCEFKRLFSIVLLRFDHGSRDAYHTHAFNSLNWVLQGFLWETFYEARRSVPLARVHKPSLLPIFTRRADFHRVRSFGTTRVLSIRGPWSRTWREYIPATNTEITLTNGRVHHSG